MIAIEATGSLHRARAAELERPLLCCVDGYHGGIEGGSMQRTRRSIAPVGMPSGFTGFRFPPEVILLAVRWYLLHLDEPARRVGAVDTFGTLVP